MTGKAWVGTRVLLLVALIGLAPALALPARAQSADAPPRTALSGYMDFHYNKRQFEDGRLDFHRFVLLVTHTYSERIRFVGELELEHALVEGLEEAGELELEQAYIDILLSPAFNVRAGMMLMPVGIINERHEPPSYYGVERPFVDTVILPTTWFEGGAGVHGEVRGWRYRAFVTAPVNAARFSAEEGMRDGRQKGADAMAARLAVTGRVEYVGRPGLTVGASLWTGESGFEFTPRFGVPVTVAETDVRYTRGPLELRGQVAEVRVGNTALLNDALAREVGVDPNIGRLMRGAYVEAGYRVIEGAPFGDVGVFARYENFDTQAAMAPGGVALPEFDRDAWVVGANYWIDPNIAFKVDLAIVRNQSAVITAPNSVNLGLGWWF